MQNNLLNAARSIGAILMDAGRLTPEGAERIMRLQKEQNLRFGDAALQLALVTEADIQFALSKQFDYAYLPPTGDKPVSDELIAAYKPFSYQVEQLRAVRSQLMMRWFDKAAGRSSLAIVGHEREAGRSYLAANLAVVFSQLGERTLLIDADMRVPRQHELFKLENRSGFSSVLAGLADVDPITQIPAFANLSVMTSGPNPPNPLELLNRPTFGQLLGRVSANYDVVLIDTPAAASGGDYGMLAARVGGALVVARRNQTMITPLNDQVNNLLQAGVAVVGSIFNDPPEDDAAAQPSAS